MSTIQEPTRRASHVADLYDRVGGTHKDKPGCDCGRCTAESLRRHLLSGRVGVVDGVTVVLKGGAR